MDRTELNVWIEDKIGLLYKMIQYFCNNSQISRFSSNTSDGGRNSPAVQKCQQLPDTLQTKPSNSGNVPVSINGSSFIKLQVNVWSLPNTLFFIVQLRWMNKDFLLFSGHTPLNCVCFGPVNTPEQQKRQSRETVVHHRCFIPQLNKIE